MQQYGYSPLAQHLTKRPEWLHVVAQVVADPTRSRPGCPRKDAVPDAVPDGAVWQVKASVTLEAEALASPVHTSLVSTMRLLPPFPWYALFS